MKTYQLREVVRTPSIDRYLVKFDVPVPTSPDDLSGGTFASAGSLAKPQLVDFTGVPTLMVLGDTSTAQGSCAWDAASDATRLTVSKAGIYLVQFAVSWGNGPISPSPPFNFPPTPAQRSVFLYQNGAKVATATVAGTDVAVDSGSALVSCAAGDYLEVYSTDTSFSSSYRYSFGGRMQAVRLT